MRGLETDTHRPRRRLGRRREIGLGEIAARLEQEHIEAALGQLLDGDASGSARADDQCIESLVKRRCHEPANCTTLRTILSIPQYRTAGKRD